MLSILFFSLNVFKMLFTQGRLKSGLCGKDQGKFMCSVIDEQGLNSL